MAVGGPHPRYTPDGRWFWTGVRWVPAADVLNPAPPQPPPAPPPAPPSRPWRVWIAASLAVLLAVGATAGLVATTRPHPGPAHPPASRIFDLPFTDRVGSAGIFGTLTLPGVVESITGAVDFTPDRALHATMYVGGAYIGEVLDSGGIGYETVEPGGPWTAETAVSLVDSALGWTGGPPPAGLHVSGRQTNGADPVWRLASRSGAQWWIDGKTGRPLRFADNTQEFRLRLGFREFGIQPAIMAPPPSNVSTLPVPGELGKVVAAPRMSLEVTAVKQAPRGLGPPPPGYRYEALRIRYENDGSEPVAFENAITLTGDHGAQYRQPSGVRLRPALPDGRLMQPGSATTGWDVFVVADHAQHLLLRAGPQTSDQDVDFLVSIPVS